MSTLVGPLLHYNWHTNHLGVLSDQLAHQWTRSSGCNWNLLSLISSGRRQLARVPWPGKEKESDFFPLPFISSFQPLLSYPFFLPSWSWIQESVWRASAWSECGSLITSSGQRTWILGLVWYLVSGRAKFPSPHPRSWGKSPVTPGHLQVSRNICKFTPFVSPSLPPAWPPFLPLNSLKAWDISIYSEALRSEVLCLSRRFSERLQSCI